MRCEDHRQEIEVGAAFSYHAFHVGKPVFADQAFQVGKRILINVSGW